MLQQKKALSITNFECVFVALAIQHATRMRLMAYADVLRTARTKQSLIDTFQQLKNNSMEVGLTFNEKKTKYLKCTKKKTSSFNHADHSFTI